MNREAAAMREPIPEVIPVECLVHHRSRRDRFAFAHEAKPRLASAPGLLLVMSHRGLHLIAAGGEPLERALATLRDNYGGALHVERNERCEPIVEARIGIELQHLNGVRAALRRRGGNPTEEYVGAHYCVLRVRMPAGWLIGLAQELAKLTSMRATHQLIVTGYASPRLRFAEKEMP
jgi:hypothetical protein